MINAQLQNILYRYANTKGTGLPLTAEEMLNAISSWLVDTLPECIDVEIEMLPVNSAPVVTLTGQGTPDNHYLLKFGIPEADEVSSVDINEAGQLVFTFTSGKKETTTQIMPSIAVGEISEGAVGSAPIIEVTGTAPNFKINFTLPKAFKIDNVFINEQGAIVVEYNDGTSTTTSVIVPTFQSEVGASLAAGETPTVVVTGTAPNYTITFRFPAQVEINGISVNDNGTLTFSFNNGSSVETSSRVVPNIAIGTVTTGEAGSQAEATIMGTTPNLILNLTIPRGNTGIQGVDGKTGFGFTDTTAQTFTPSNVTYSNGVATIHGTMSTEDGTESVESELTFELPIEAGDGVTIDANEAGDSIVVSANALPLFCHNIQLDVSTQATIGAIAYFSFLSHSSTRCNNVGDILSALDAYEVDTNFVSTMRGKLNGEPIVLARVVKGASSIIVYINSADNTTTVSLPPESSCEDNVTSSL